MDELVLPTPNDFPMFPYDQPYGIQRDLMRHLYQSIETAKVTIVESPTGTGKTLSLLTGSLSWLADERARSKLGQLMAIETSLRNGTEGSTEPEWVLAQNIENHKRELEARENDFDERLEKARRREESLRRMEKAHVRKKTKLNHEPENDDQDENRFLPMDETITDDNLSPAVRNLMKKLGAANSGGHVLEDEAPTRTKVKIALNRLQTSIKDEKKIYYASRTHSQLAQLHTEFIKLKPLVHDHPVARVVPLASRKVLCINDNLRSKSTDLDEGCRELMSGQRDQRCPHLPTLDEESRMLDFRDHILAIPRDIEDLVILGKELNTCPYYGSRKAIKQAELVTLPYNLLLQKSAREALGIDLSGQVVVVDEAHNLIDTILSIHSLSLSSTTLKLSLRQLNNYFARFRTRLTPMNALFIKQLLSFLQALDQFCDKFKYSDGKDELMTTNQLTNQLASKAQGLNLVEILAYLRSSKLAHKITSYTDASEVKATEKDPAVPESRKKGANPPLHAVEAFLSALTDPNDDGHVSISVIPDKPGVILKYQLLNPARHFREITSSARSVVLAGGTMSPLSDFVTQLFPSLPPDRLNSFSCGHVIPVQNLKVIVVGRGPRGGELQFKFQQRGDPELMAELAQILSNLTNVVPSGLVVFFPSFAFLNKVKSARVLEKLGEKKTIFYEPQEAGNVDSVLKDFSSAIYDGPKKGAILMAVVGAKLSEGLNFSDELARAVVLIGLPFANLGSVELKERMRYVKELEERGGKKLGPGAKDAGIELYENICMRAVNQSIGRAIRHQNDWASLILVDSRYASPRIRSKLPQWIGQEITITTSFGQVIKELGTFFKARRDSSTS